MLKAGQKLKEERIRKKLTLDDVEKSTKIKKAFLIAIERGEYNKLPSSSYAQGFVRNYSEYLGLPVGQTLAIFRREFDERKVYRVLPDSMTRGENVPRRNFRINTRIIIISAVFLLLIGFISYQFRFAVLNPPLDIDTPAEGASTGQDVTIAGTSDANAAITVNDEPVAVDAEGDFMKKISLFPGKTTITIKSRSAFGKETIVERNVIVKE